MSHRDHHRIPYEDWGASDDAWSTSPSTTWNSRDPFTGHEAMGATENWETNAPFGAADLSGSGDDWLNPPTTAQASLASPTAAGVAMGTHPRGRMRRLSLAFLIAAALSFLLFCYIIIISIPNMLARFNALNSSWIRSGTGITIATVVAFVLVAAALVFAIIAAIRRDSRIAGLITIAAIVVLGFGAVQWSVARSAASAEMAARSSIASVVQTVDWTSLSEVDAERIGEQLQAVMDTTGVSSETIRSYIPQSVWDKIPSDQARDHLKQIVGEK